MLLIRPGLALIHATGRRPSRRGAGVELQDDVLRRVLREDVHRRFALSSGRHSIWWLWKPVAILCGRSFSAAAVSESANAFQPSAPDALPALATMMYVLPMI